MGVIVALLGSVLAFSVTQGLAVPGIGAVATDFGTTVATATWVLTVNLAVTAVSVPLIGRLGDMFGRRRLLVAVLATVAAGGFLSALAPGLGLIVAGRAVQGIGGGVFSLCFGLAREHVPVERRRRAIGLLGAAAGVGGALGLPLGGWLMDLGSYTWLFWAGAWMSLAAAVGVVVLVPESGARAPARVDLPGAVVLAAAVGLPLIALGRAGVVGWSDPRIVASFAGALALLAVFVHLERRARPALIDLGSIRSIGVVVPNVATALVGAASFAVMVLVPQYALSDDGPAASATVSGLLLLPASLATLTAGALAGWFTARSGSRPVLLTGVVLTATGMLALTVQHTGLLSLVLGSLVVFGGVGLSLAAFANLIVDAVPAHRTGEATGVNGLFRIAGSALGAQLAVVVASAGATDEITSRGMELAFRGLTVALLPAIALAVLLPSVTPSEKRTE